MKETLQQLAELNDEYLELKSENQSLKKQIFELRKALIIVRQNEILEKSHKELIICPKCKHECNATVIHTIPFFTYIHNCHNCHYVITESNWDLKS
jgi:hypothetical protein